MGEEEKRSEVFCVLPKEVELLGAQHALRFETLRFQYFHYGETSVSPTPFPFQSPRKNKFKRIFLCAPERI